jgi:YgiT-type zinc finger domain-containing protein
MASRRYSSCSYCGSNVDELLVSLEIWIGDRLVLFRDVPAGVCDHCGEEFFGADIQEKLFEMAKNTPRSVIEVPVYHFSDALTAAKAEAGRKKKERNADTSEADQQLATDDEIADLLHTSFEEWDEQ